MERTEYIEFEIKNDDNFKDLSRVLTLISESRKLSESQTDEFWLKSFPNYALKNYYFGEDDLKPEFETASIESGGTWHFYSMTEHLEDNLDVELQDCIKITPVKGRLNFIANGYPYGGITGLTMFLKSFDLKATKIDEGAGVYDVKWKNETEFELKEIKTVANNGYNSLWHRVKRKFNL